MALFCVQVEGWSPPQNFTELPSTFKLLKTSTCLDNLHFHICYVFRESDIILSQSERRGPNFHRLLTVGTLSTFVYPAAFLPRAISVRAQNIPLTWNL